MPVRLWPGPLVIFSLPNKVDTHRSPWFTGFVGTSLDTIPKVCTWETFINEALHAGILDRTEFVNMVGVASDLGVKQAEAEGWQMWEWNLSGQRLHGTGTRVWARKPREFWLEFAPRAGLILAA